MKYLNKENSRPGALTVPVLGCPRGGTSMVTGVLEFLGVNMGTQKRNNFQLEDAPFAKWQVDSDMLNTVKERNKVFKKWGFKYPNSIYYIRSLAPKLRNPHYVAIFRNHLSIAESSADKDKDRTFGPHLLAVARRHQSEVENILIETTYPAALYSFEAALAAPKDFIDSLVNFLHITPSKQQLQKACKWINPDKGYQDITTFKAVDVHGEPIRKDSQ